MLRKGKFLQLHHILGIFCFIQLYIALEGSLRLRNLMYDSTVQYSTVRACVQGFFNDSKN